jgi:hypothetical protein
MADYSGREHWERFSTVRKNAFARVGDLDYVMNDLQDSQSFVLDADDVAITIDADTTDTTAAALITADIGVNSSSTNFINATIDVGTALSAAEIVKGCYFDMNPLATDANTSGLIGYDVLMTGVATSRADLTGYKVTFDGTHDDGDTVTGVLVSGGTATVNDTAIAVHGIEIDFDSVVDTDYATGEFNALDITMPAAYQGTDVASGIKVAGAGAQVDILSGAGTIYGVDVTAAAGTVPINIDCGTTDTTAATIINADVDVNSANCNFINATIDIGTLLSAGEVVRGIYFDVNEAVVNADTSQIIGSEYQMTAFATAANDLIGAEVNFDGTKSAAGDVYGININSDSLTLNSASAVFAGVAVDASGMTNTSSSSAYGISSTVGSTADGAIYATDGTQVLTVCDGTSHIDASASLITNMPVPTVGTDITTATAPAYWIPYGKKGASGMTVTEFYIDLTGLSSVADDGDVIGDTGETSGAALGIYTTAVMGTIAAIEMVCLEAPVGGTADIDLYSNSDTTLYIDEDASGGTQLIAAGGAWTNGAVKGATALPTAAHAFYLTSGTAAAGDYSAGKFIIRIYGT